MLNPARGSTCWVANIEASEKQLVAVMLELNPVGSRWRYGIDVVPIVLWGHTVDD